MSILLMLAPRATGYRATGFQPVTVIALQALSFQPLEAAGTHGLEAHGALGLEGRATTLAAGSGWHTWPG